MTDASPPAEDDEPIDDRTGLADHPLTALRLAKHEAILEAGGYPFRFDRSDTAADLHERYPDIEPGSETEDEVRVAGRLLNTRDMGRLIFGVLNDVSGDIQLFVSKGVLGDAFAEFADLDAGDWLGVTGTVMTTRKGELSVKVTSFTLLAKALRPLPDKWHGLRDVEARSRQRYVDLMINPESRQIALTRAQIVGEFRRLFSERGYIEVETPILLNQATGAMARPFETHHNALDLDMSLRIATELYLKRLIVGGLEKVFEIGRIFRNEGIDATHNPEFTMLESYEAFADYGDIAEMVEQMIAVVAENVTGGTVIEYQGRPLDLTPPFARRRMVDMVAEVVGEPVGFAESSVDDLRSLADRHGVDVAPYWGHGKLIEALFDQLVEPTIWDPVYVMDHPKEISPLARHRTDDPNLTERWELFIASSEYANAFSELNEPIDQRARFEEQAQAKAAGDDEAQTIDEDFVRALEYGMPPTGGLGIGIDRLVMLLTDRAHIREVILFPTLRPE
jgi:lysyl-tRNA synthetase class 2